MRTKYQVPSEEINRSTIKNAPYNPRKITDKAKAKLKANIRKHGLMGGIVVNKNSMNLVSGHQRLSVLDSLEKSEDYIINIEWAELTEKEEKEQNLFMNNANVQGEFDTDMLVSLIPEINYELAGFDQYDMNMLGILEVETEEQPVETFQEIQDLKKPLQERAAETKTLKAEIKAKQSEKAAESESYVIVSFDSYINKSAFMNRFGFQPAEKFIKGEVFSEMIERIDSE